MSLACNLVVRLSKSIEILCGLKFFSTNSGSAFIKAWPFFPLYGYRLGLTSFPPYA